MPRGIYDRSKAKSRKPRKRLTSEDHYLYVAQTAIAKNEVNLLLTILKKEIETAKNTILSQEKLLK